MQEEEQIVTQYVMYSSMMNTWWIYQLTEREGDECKSNILDSHLQTKKLLSCMCYLVCSHMCYLIIAPWGVGNIPLSRCENCLLEIKRISRTHCSYCVIQLGFKTIFSLKTFPSLDHSARRCAGSRSSKSEVVAPFGMQTLYRKSSLLEDNWCLEKVT